MNIAMERVVLQPQKSIQTYLVRTFYFTFKRKRVPPLQQPRESPYIVGPYLKPDYLPREYVTEPLKHRYIDDFDHIHYEFQKVEPDPNRTVKLLLIDDVEGLGVAGQVVHALAKNNPGKLIAMKKAEYYSDFAVKWYKFGPKTSKSASSALSPRTVRMLQSQTFRLPVTNKTVVEAWHVSLALRLAGCICPTEAVDDIKMDNEDTLLCTIVINNHERVPVKFNFRPGEILLEDTKPSKDIFDNIDDGNDDRL